MEVSIHWQYRSALGCTVIVTAPLTFTDATLLVLIIVLSTATFIMAPYYHIYAIVFTATSPGRNPDYGGFD